MNRNDVLKPGAYASMPKALLAVSSTKLTPAAKLVWMAVVERFGENEESWPGAGQIASDTGLTRRGVQKALDRLIELKLLTAVAPRPGRDSNTYRLTDFPGALAALANRVRHPGEQSSLPSAQSSLAGSERSAPELPNRTTQVTIGGACGPGDPAGRPTGAALADPSPAKHSPSQGDKHEPAKHGKKESTRTSLKREDVEAVCVSFDAMQRYILHGVQAVHDPAGEYPPSDINWRRFAKSEQDYGVKDWDVKAFMGFYWFQVCAWRNTRNLPLTLPSWGRLAGDIKNLQKTMTNLQLYQLVMFTTYYFDLIRFMVGRAGLSLNLQEDSLSNSMIRGAANQLINMGETGRAAMLEKYTTLLGKFAA